MRNILIVDMEDFDNFQEYLDEKTNNNTYRVVSSNAYFDGNVTRFYALLEKDGLIQELASSASNIDTNIMTGGIG